MVYRLNYTSVARESIDACIEYLLYSVGGAGNIQAAENFLKDYSETIAKIANSAESYALCENEKLRALGIHKVHFGRMKYKVFYTIEGDVVIVQLVCHDLRNFQELF